MFTVQEKEYKSIIISKMRKESAERAIDEAMNEMSKKGWEFVSISGTLGYGIVLIFSRKLNY